jgi:hypothetical protein
MGPVQAAEQPDTDADLLESAFPHVSAKNFAEPCRSHARRVNREIRHSPHPPCGWSNLTISCGESVLIGNLKRLRWGRVNSLAEQT